jgi:hypothetical protein
MLSFTRFRQQRKSASPEQPHVHAYVSVLRQCISCQLLLCCASQNPAAYQRLQANAAVIIKAVCDSVADATVPGI